MIYNDAARDLMGTKHPAALGRPGQQSWGEIADFFRPLFERVMTSQTVAFEDQLFRIRRYENLEDAYFTFSYSPVRDETGKVAGVLVNCRETTDQVRGRSSLAERERLNEELKVERSRLEFVFQRAPSFLAVLRGPEYTFELVNEAYSQLIGKRSSRGKPLLDALPELRGQGVVEILDQVVRTGEPYLGREVPVRLARTPGEPPQERFVDLVYLPLIDPDGTRSGIISHGTDVTEHVLAQRRMEEQARALEVQTARLAESQERLRLALDAGAMAYWDFDPGSNTTNRSLQHDRLYGYDTPLPRWNFEIFFSHVHPDDQAYVADRFKRTLEADEEWKVDCRVVWPDGSVHWIPTQGSVFRDADGEPVHIMGLVSDVTARKTAEAERESLLGEAHAARMEAEAANRSKMDFLSAMSHELRTPLNAIGGYAELLEMGIHGPVTAAQRTALKRITTGQRHLLVLINDILSHARLEAGRLEFDLRSLPVSDLLRSVEPLILPQAQAKGTALSIQSCDPALRLIGDEERVRQILLNLAGNAVKFTDSGGWVVLTCEADEDWARLRVQDNGRGISVEDQALVFDAFRQVERRLDEPREGVGLGLAISRELARAMGGDLSVESTPGEGSTFTLRLPRKERQPEGRR